MEMAMEELWNTLGWKYLPLRKCEGKSCKSPQMCFLDGNGRGLELQESVTECRPAGRGINLNGITLLLLFSACPPTPPPFFILHSFSLAALLFLSFSPWLFPLFCKALQERQRDLWHQGEQLWFEWCLHCSSHIQVLFFCINYILKRHQHTLVKKVVTFLLLWLLRHYSVLCYVVEYIF